jgi:hypothetical protein
MGCLKKPKVPFLLVLAGCLFLSIAPASWGFMTLSHEWQQRFGVLLITKVHAPHWTIHYSFENCGPVDEDTRVGYEQVLTKFIQSWLQPLREYTKRPIVNDFRYHLKADWRGADFGITTICGLGNSWALIRHPLGIKHKPSKLELTWRLMSAILHELGHLFGLGDTYLPGKDWGKPGLDTGGLDNTKGSQPSSVMSGMVPTDMERAKDNFDRDKPMPLQGLALLGKDDSNGIIWLYKFTYEGLVLEDCFFPNYELQATPLGCVPKYPLIFQLKHGLEQIATLIIKDDEGLDVNAQDKDGLTALHHAVIHEFAKVIGMLLARPDIKPFLKSKDGLTPLQLANQLKRDHIARLIAAHPRAMPVDAKGKLATTWGRIKQSY